MTTTPAEMAEEYERLAAKYEADVHYLIGDDAMRTRRLIARACRLAADAARAEPVAWQHKLQTWDEKWTAWYPGKFEPGPGADPKQWYRFEERPLYAAPPATPDRFRDGVESAALKLETMKFLLSISSPADGPFSRQQKAIDEVVAQGAAAIRNLAKE